MKSWGIKLINFFYLIRNIKPFEFIFMRLGEYSIKINPVKLIILITLKTICFVLISLGK